MNKTTRHILRFLLLLTIQVLICNHVQLFGFMNPYIYIMAILLLPLEIPRSAQYLIGFLTGLIVDLFTMTYGVQASATLMVVFVRPHIVHLLNGRRIPDGIDRPVPGVKDFKWLFLYTLILVFIHHFMITLLEIFSFKNFGYTLLVSIANALFTTFIILCAEYIFSPLKKR